MGYISIRIITYRERENVSIMKCEMCSNHNAVIQIQQIINNKKRSVRLCETCAKGLGILGIGLDENKDITIPDLFSHVFEGIKEVSVSQNRKCKNCGSTLKKIIKEHKVGCTECYTVFQKQIRKIINAHAGDSEHKGKLPKRFALYRKFLTDIGSLKKQLKNALKEENYESAAVLRDAISKLKNSDW
jgi:protein arginine kinase activator